MVVNGVRNFPVYWLLDLLTVNHQIYLAMKTMFSSKTIIALAVAVAATAGYVSLANEQPMPPPANGVALPASIPPGSTLAEVVKLVQAGTDASVIRSYIANSTSAFNLDAEKILALADIGVPTELIDAMLERDKSFSVAAATPPVAPARSESYSAPPTTTVTVNYFNESLSPYGSWVEIEGYGRCWRPTTVIYDSTWRPYCDRGHWVYTDCGWYWDSDYSWGATFHYGRWFRHDRFGWCWWPDTVWAPSWVSWRQSDAYCGWAPLPPFSIYRPGVGFFYRGANVAIGFDFGIGYDCYNFVSFGHFYDRHPRYFCEDRSRVQQIFHQTTVINNFNININKTTIVNHGIPVDRIRAAIHQPLQPVAVAQLPNATRHGWQGGDAGRGSHQPEPRVSGGNSRNSASPSASHAPDARESRNHNDGIRRQDSGPSGRADAVNPADRTIQPPTAGSHNNSRDRENGNHNGNPPVAAPQNVMPPANNHSSATPYNREQPQRSTPPVTRTIPERSQPQITPPSTGIRPERSTAPQSDWRQSRSAEAPTVVTPPQRSVPQVEPRQFTPPPAAPRMEQHQSPPASQPRSYTPPPAPPRPSPAPAPSQPSRSYDHGSSKDKDR